MSKKVLVIMDEKELESLRTDAWVVVAPASVLPGWKSVAESACYRLTCECAERECTGKCTQALAARMLGRLRMVAQ